MTLGWLAASPISPESIAAPSSSCFCLRSIPSSMGSLARGFRRCISLSIALMSVAFLAVISSLRAASLCCSSSCKVMSPTSRPSILYRGVNRSASEAKENPVSDAVWSRGINSISSPIKTLASPPSTPTIWPVSCCPSASYTASSVSLAIASPTNSSLRGAKGVDC